MSAEGVPVGRRGAPSNRLRAGIPYHAEDAHVADEEAARKTFETFTVTATGSSPRWSSSRPWWSWAPPLHSRPEPRRFAATRDANVDGVLAFEAFYSRARDI